MSNVLQKRTLTYLGAEALRNHLRKAIHEKSFEYDVGFYSTSYNQDTWGWKTRVVNGKASSKLFAKVFITVAKRAFLNSGAQGMLEEMDCWDVDVVFPVFRVHQCSE